MTYQEAITAVKNGQTVKRTAWNNSKTIQLITTGDQTIIGSRKVITTNLPYTATQEDMFANDWTT